MPVSCHPPSTILVPGIYSPPDKFTSPKQGSRRSQNRLFPGRVKRIYGFLCSFKSSHGATLSSKSKREDWKNFHIYSFKPEPTFHIFLFENKLRQVSLKTIPDLFRRYPGLIADLGNGCISILGIDSQLVKSRGNLQILRITKRLDH